MKNIDHLAGAMAEPSVAILVSVTLTSVALCEKLTADESVPKQHRDTAKAILTMAKALQSA